MIPQDLPRTDTGRRCAILSRSSFVYYAAAVTAAVVNFTAMTFL